MKLNKITNWGDDLIEVPCTDGGTTLVPAGAIPKGAKINMVSKKMEVHNISTQDFGLEDFTEDWSKNSSKEKTKKEKTYKSSNITRDTIALALEVSYRSGVPILFLSNPGEGKTTGVKTFGKVHNKHVEFLMGAQYTQEDVLGFMTNTGKEYLEVKIPEWYYRIMEYTKWHWEIKEEPNFELGYADRKKLIEEKKMYLAYKNGKFTEEQLLDMDIPFDKINIDEKIAEINKELEDKFVWTAPRGTILFLDELSAATPTVQAALLRLCHEKTLRGNNKLPKDCIVCAAGNFKRNLPSFMEIIAPELNRFCIINLIRGNSKKSLQTIGSELVIEATYDFYENIDNFPRYDDTFEFSPKMKKDFLKKYQEGLIKLFEDYSGEDSPNGVLDLRNTNFDGMFDGTDNIPEISNFISLRSISYLARTLKALCELKIQPAYLNEVYKKFAIGLLGLGTNSWDSRIDDKELQLENFHKALSYTIGDLLSEFNHPSKESLTVGKESLLNETTEVIKGSINETIRDYIDVIAIKGFSAELISQLQNLLPRIEKEFPESSIEMLLTLRSRTSIPDIIAWRADYEAIKLLTKALESFTESFYYLDAYVTALKIVINKYEFYYNTSLSGISLDSLKR